MLNSTPLTLEKEVIVRANELIDQGIAFYGEGQFLEAIRVSRQALELLEPTNSPYQRGILLDLIGQSHSQMGDLVVALNYYELSASAFRQAGAIDRVGRVLNTIGASYNEMGQFDTALDVFQQALPLLQQANDSYEQGNVLNNRGYSYFHLGRYYEALDSYQQALVMRDNVQDFGGRIVTQYNIGNVYTALGQYPLAIDLYRQVLDAVVALGDRSSESTILSNIAYAYTREKRYVEAIERYQQALMIAVEIGDRTLEGKIANNLGEAYRYIGQYEQSLTLLERSLQLTRATGDRYFEGRVLDSLGSLKKAQNDIYAALSYYEQALTVSQEIGDSETERLVLHNLGDLWSRQYQTTLAIAFYKQSVNVTEEIRRGLRSLPRDQRESYTETVADTYRQLADLLLQQNRLIEAQQVLELLKVEELREFTGVRATVTAEGVRYTPAEQQVLEAHGSLIAFGRALSACQQARCAELSVLGDRRQALVAEFNELVRSLEAEIRDRKGLDRAFYDPSSLLSRSQAIVKLQPGTVLIYPFVLEDRLWLLWATENTVGKYDVSVTRQQLGEAAVRLRTLLGSPYSNINELKAVSQELYDWLILPLEAELGRNQIQHLVFALDRVTRYLPVAALYDGEQYLVERYTIASVLSAELTNTEVNPPLLPQISNVLAVGVSQAVAGFEALPYVPAELDALVLQDSGDERGLYPGRSFLDQEFTRPNLRDNVYGQRILHIATHAVFESSNYDASYLLLGTGNRFPIREIQDTLPILNDVELVVLSACQTALGAPGQDGLEIPGIAYYFLNNGAKTVMASLWNVNDASTSVLMQEFYSQLAAGTEQERVSKAEALRRAQLRFLRGEIISSGDAERGIVGIRPRVPGNVSESESGDLSHPFYWAPFILIGNGL